MLTLYMKKGCPYCARVLEVLHDEIGVPFTAKYVEDPAVAQELLLRGGKRQEPYLVDDSNGTEMYESDDIIAYLTNAYGQTG